MGLEENRALTLARGCGRSLTALARLIPGGSYDPPAWVEKKGKELLPGILAGAWDSSNAQDREIVEQIAGGVSCMEVEGHARSFLRNADPPFDLEGSIWKVRAPMDAFVRVGPLIGPNEAELLRTAMLKVFAEIRREPGPDEIVNFSQPTATAYSEWLRDGLATTLLLFALWSEIAEVNLGGESGQDFANRTLSDLPGLRTNPRVLTSLQNELPLLAEAAPDPLLSALEQMLEGTGDAILPIFDERSGWLYPTSGHTGVIWALETLAWDPQYFRRAVMVLARLAEIDPGGHLGNRPQNSLAEIFVLWNPNTNASSAQRLSALDEIVKDHPTLGWQLILALLPTSHGASSPTAKPRLREAGAADRPAITYGELWANQAAVAERAIDLADSNSTRWMGLIGKIAGFAPRERSKAAAALDNTLANFDESERKPLWTKLRDEVARHERFKTAPWALPEQELSALRSIAEKYAPTDPISRVVTLFSSAALDVTLDQSQANHRRSTALQQLYAEAGGEAVLRLVTEIEVPYLIIQALDTPNFLASQIFDILMLSFNQDPNSSFTLALSGLYRKVAGEEGAEAWLRYLIRDKSVPTDTIGKLLLAWPDGIETWNVARRLGSQVVDTYWKQKFPLFLKGPRSELLRALLMLLRYGRAQEAIQSSLQRMSEVPSKLILRMLSGVIAQINEKAATPSAMTSFYVEEALKSLDQRPDVTENEIAAFEYKLFPLLEHGNRSLRIYNVLANDPALFHSFLRNVYLRKNEEKGEISAQAEANARLSYSLLSHFSMLPGQVEHEIDGQVLTAWVDEVRRLGVETDRADITDVYVGRVLAHAPPDPDGAWPHHAVRAQIERLASDEIERAIQVERFNMRGVFSRGIYDGGAQERDLAAANYTAAKVAESWPRTAAMLRSIGGMWTEEGKRADLDAAQRRLRS